MVLVQNLVKYRSLNNGCIWQLQISARSPFGQRDRQSPKSVAAVLPFGLPPSEPLILIDAECGLITVHCCSRNPKHSFITKPRVQSSAPWLIDGCIGDVIVTLPLQCRAQTCCNLAWQCTVLISDCDSQIQLIMPCCCMRCFSAWLYQSSLHCQHEHRSLFMAFQQLEQNQETKPTASVSRRYFLCQTEFTIVTDIND